MRVWSMELAPPPALDVFLSALVSGPSLRWLSFPGALNVVLDFLETPPFAGSVGVAISSSPHVVLVVVVVVVVGFVCSSRVF